MAPHVRTQPASTYTIADISRLGCALTSSAYLPQVQKSGVAPSHRRAKWMQWSGAAALKEARPSWYNACNHKCTVHRDMDENPLQAQFDQVEIDLER